MFATVLQATLPGHSNMRINIPRLFIKANCLANTGFFCGALFWSSPAWTGLLIIVPAILFGGVVLLVMREHARHVLDERRQSRS